MAGADIRGLDIGMLRAFDALMRERSVSRAATQLFLSQPAVSASLNRLRKVFNDPLFTRTAHGVAPTARAEALAPQVEQVLAQLAALLQDQAAFDPALSDRVFRIAGSDHASRSVLPPLVHTLNACGSGIRIVWEPPAPASVPERLARGDIDLAVIARIRPPRDLQTVPLYEDRYVYALRRGHPRAAEPVTLDLFCTIPQTFLGYGSSVLDDRIDEVLARHGRRRQAQVAVNSFGQVLHLMEHADHAAVLGSRVAAAFGERLQVQPVPFELPSYQSFLCWDARTEGDAALQWLRAQVLQIHGRA
jgi:DNA-binding transcriptional LysR family regulator